MNKFLLVALVTVSLCLSPYLVNAQVIETYGAGGGNGDMGRFGAYDSNTFDYYTFFQTTSAPVPFGEIKEGVLYNGVSLTTRFSNKSDVGHTHIASEISNSTNTGRSVLTASNAAAARTAIGAGTSSFSGSYNDLSDKPTIPSAQINSDWNSVSGYSQILNKPSLSIVATTGAYSDLIGKPSIPTAQVQSDWNASTGLGVILNKPTIPSNTNQLTNGAGFITSAGAPVQSVNGQTGAVVLSLPSTTRTTSAFTPSLVTSTSGGGIQISSTKDSTTRVSFTIQNTVSLSGNSSGYIVAEIASTNSSTAGDWTEVGRCSDGQSGTLVIGLVLNQTGGCQITNDIPSGWYIRFRSVNVSGTPTYTVNPGQKTIYG